ncbi:MAG: rod shape-determining protein MreD [Brevinematia bacterium]|jgi:rod shape-determining protein MreD
MKKFWAILILSLVAIVQVIPQFKMHGFFPDLIVVFLVYYTFALGTNKGIIMSAIIGAFVDVLSGSIVGTHILTYSTISFSIEIYRNVFIFESLLTVPIVSFFSVVTKYIILFLLSLLFNAVSLGNWYVVMFIEGFITFIFAFPMVWLSKIIISLLHREYEIYRSF